jgi:rubrerythrin
MSLEQAIKAAMDVESKIRNLYLKAFEQCKDAAGKRFFAMLGDDEQYHHDYLSHRLEELQQAGEIQYPDLKANVPSAAQITSCLNAAQKSMAVEDRGVMQQMLSNALHVEVTTSEFYKKMVEQNDGASQKMFARFLEIEDGHITAVQTELDYVMNTGYWFDMKEFDME